MNIGKQLLSLMLGGGLAVAASADFEREELDLAPGLRVSPELRAAYLSDSNFYFSGSDEKSVNGAVVSPGIKIQSNTVRSRLVVGALAEGGFFDSGSEDDYVDSHIYGRYSYRGGTRHRFFLGVAGKDEHDAFGRRRTEGTSLRSQELDEYDQAVGNLSYRYGARDAYFNLELDLNYIDREYTTNRDLGTRFLDHDAFGQAATLYFNASPKTALLFKLGNRDIEYGEVRPGSRDRSANEGRVTVGAEWIASGKTTGRFLVSRVDRDPDSAGFETFSAVGWAANLQWTPRITTTINLTTARETEESFLTNSSFIDTKTISVSWSQQWSRIFSTNVGSTYSDRDFEDINREDDTVAFAVGGTLQVSKTIDVFAKYQYLDRDSTIFQRIYEKNIAQIGFQYRR